jgi:hypothetical protein
MQVAEKNSQMEDSFRQVRGFSLKQVIPIWHLDPNPSPIIQRIYNLWETQRHNQVNRLVVSASYFVLN